MKHLFTLALFSLAMTANASDLDTAMPTLQSDICMNDTILNLTGKDSITENIEKSYVIDENNMHLSFIWQKKERKCMRSHWSGFGMSFMNYDDGKVPHGALKRSSSHNFTLNIMSYGKQIARSNWMWVTGMGFEWSRYHFNNNAALTTVDGITSFVRAPEGVNYKSSKLLSYYITVPLMLEYHFSEFHVAAGAVAYFKYYSKSQVEYYDEAGNKHRDNMGRDLNIRPVDLRLKVQIGMDNFNLFAYYAPISMFEGSKGPSLKTYNIGAMLSF